MKKSVKNILEMQIDAVKESVFALFKNKIDEDKLSKIYDEIVTDYGSIIANNYNLEEIYMNTNLLYRLALIICLNYIFDNDRIEDLVFSGEEYINNFKGRIVSQMIYSDLSNNILNLSKFLNHPSVLSIITISNLLNYRIPFDCKCLIEEKNVDYTPIFVLLKEAFKSLISTYQLFDSKCFNQGMTIFRMYLEQFIVCYTLLLNPHLFDKYQEHQRLTILYANDTSNKEVQKIIEEKNIPARDIKSYLNYGWIESIKGFEELGKKRYSIKMMAILSNVEQVYELYSETTNYAHMNLLYANIDWNKEIVNIIQATMITLSNIVAAYEALTGYNLNYKNIDLKEEFNSICHETLNAINSSKFSI